MLTAPSDERLQSVAGVAPDLAVTARAAGGAGIDRACRAVKAFGVLDFAAPQVEVAHSGGVFPWAAWTMPVHRRGRDRPFGSMCVMCGTVTWRDR